MSPRRPEAPTTGSARTWPHGERPRATQPSGQRFARLLQLVFCVAWTGQAIAQESSLFSIHQHPGYSEPQKSLELLVRTQGTRRLNHFCVIGYREPSGYEYAWVHWEEGKALILWEPAADPARPEPLSTARRFLRLDRDVVASEEHLGGSSYLVTRQWVSRVTSDCKAHGDKFKISKQQRKEQERTSGG
jgi:hypothetical protein